jgi:enoyl-CoA hydratase
MIKTNRESAHVVSLTLDRPEVYNALNFEVLEELSRTLDDLAGGDVRALIITGAGKSFCSGADLKEIGGFFPEEAKRFSLAGHRAFDKIEGFPCPVIAGVNGFALGGGCELACACDLIYASDRAKFGQPEAKVGMITGWGGTFRLAERIGRHRAKELFFTGRIITAAEAREIGLVNGIFPAEDFWKNIIAAAGMIAANAPIPIRLEKSMMNRIHADPEARRTAEAEALYRCVETADQKEGVAAFLEKRSPVFKNL